MTEHIEQRLILWVDALFSRTDVLSQKSEGRVLFEGNTVYPKGHRLWANEARASLSFLSESVGEADLGSYLIAGDDEEDRYDFFLNIPPNGSEASGVAHKVREALLQGARIGFDMTVRNTQVDGFLVEGKILKCAIVEQLFSPASPSKELVI